MKAQRQAAAPRPPFPAETKYRPILAKKPLKNRNQTFPAVDHFTRKLELVSNKKVSYLPHTRLTPIPATLPGEVKKYTPQKNNSSADAFP